MYDPNMHKRKSKIDNPAYKEAIKHGDKTRRVMKHADL